MIDGDMRVNGKPVTLEEINEYSGYVQQNDLFHGTLTVREHLTFLVNLRIFLAHVTFYSIILKFKGSFEIGFVVFRRKVCKNRRNNQPSKCQLCSYANPIFLVLLWVVPLKVNLTKAQDTYIGMGDKLKGISGGEKRRLAFASEVQS